MKDQRGGIILLLIFLLFLAAVCGVAYLLRRPLLQWAGNAWMIEDPLEHADALLVLSDDNVDGERAAHAALLYQRGLAPVVVGSGRRLRRYAGIAELMEHDLAAHGVPKGAIMRYAHDAENTREEAESLEKLVRERKWRRVIVVTSNYHARRARYIFRRVFPPQVEVRVAGAPDEDFDPGKWWEKRSGIKRMFQETIGMAVAMWELRGKKEAEAEPQALVGVARLNPQHIV
ncbi:MAG: YdcF family protein [Acidobacteriia bacterium]|nr:YdcF family protein [Terriglobia bacterium]